MLRLEVWIPELKEVAFGARVRLQTCVSHQGRRLLMRHSTFIVGI